MVMERSAESATCTLMDAVLLPRFGSVTLLETDAVSVMVLPEAPLNETKVVLAGRVSVTVRVVAVAGPALKMVCV